jgi:hypothetical protein
VHFHRAEEDEADAACGGIARHLLRQLHVHALELFGACASMGDRGQVHQNVSTDEARVS